MTQSPPVLDIDALVAPIEGDNPAGVDLREVDPAVFYEIRDARTAASRAENDALTGTSTEPADWRSVVELATRALATRSKSLDVAAFLIEALVREAGFAGLRDGFRVARELVERYWDGLYPLPDDYGYETRVYTLGCLNGYEGDGTLTAAVDRTLVIAGRSVGPFALWQYRQAVEVSRLEDESRRQQKLDAGAARLDEVQVAIAETPAEFFRDLIDDLTAAQDEFQLLTATLDERCGGTSPPSSVIRRVLSDAKETIEQFARDKLAALAYSEEAAIEEGGEAADSGAPSGGASAGGPIRTRDDALRALHQVMEFFRRTEPHTPVSYCIEQAIRWGRMPLPDLLAELIADDSVRQNVFKQIGIPRAEESSGY